MDDYRDDLSHAGNRITIQMKSPSSKTFCMYTDRNLLNLLNDPLRLNL